MKAEKRLILSLVAETMQERDSWRNLLSSYSWADGEFGMLCTEAAFREFCAEVKNKTIDISARLKRDMCRFDALLSSGRYADVCLENGIAGT